jgi:hypothetical protein
MFILLKNHKIRITIFKYNSQYYKKNIKLNFGEIKFNLIFNSILLKFS